MNNNDLIILKSRLSTISLLSMVEELLQTSRPLKVAICNVNSVVRSYMDEDLKSSINSHDYATTDGMPLVWAAKLLGHRKQERVDGYSIFYKTIEEGINKNTKHYFYGSTEDALSKIVFNLNRDFPSINIVGTHSPPFGDTIDSSYEKLYEDISILKPDIVWVGLGMPKQELFISNISRDTGNIKFVGVGAVFNWVSEIEKKAPMLIQRIGLEWFFRLINNPKRLWRRYLVDNSIFIVLIFIQVIKKYTNR